MYDIVHQRRFAGGRLSLYPVESLPVHQPVGKTSAVVLFKYPPERLLMSTRNLYTADIYLAKREPFEQCCLPGSLFAAVIDVALSRDVCRTMSAPT